MVDADNITNPYDVLGVARGVDDAALRRAYRDAVKRCHPDHGGDPAEFIGVQEAYEQLSDPQRRAELDEFLDSPRPDHADTSTVSGDAGPAAAQPRERTRSTADNGARRRSRVRRTPTPRQVLEGWLEARCLFECDIRGIRLDLLDQRAEAAQYAADTLRSSDGFDAAITEILATWRERVTEIRHEVMAETAPDELGAKLRRGPANKGLFTDRALAVAFTAAVGVLAYVTAALFGAGGTVEAVGTSPVTLAAAASLSALWWAPRWAAGWVRLGWGRRARRAALAAVPVAGALSAGFWGQWVLWGAVTATVGVASALAGWVGDRRLRHRFPPPVWGPQRRLRSFRERAADRAAARSAKRRSRQ